MRCRTIVFLDYIATNKVVPEVIEQIVKGIVMSNGYSLVRKLINESGIDLASNFDNRPFIDVFLEPTKLYVKPVLALKRSFYYWWQ